MPVLYTLHATQKTYINQSTLQIETDLTSLKRKKFWGKTCTANWGVCEVLVCLFVLRFKITLIRIKDNLKAEKKFLKMHFFFCDLKN